MQPSDSLPLKKDYYIGLIFPVLAEGHSSVTLSQKILSTKLNLTETLTYNFENLILLLNSVCNFAFIFQVLLSRLSFFSGKDISGNSGLRMYRKTAEAVMCGLLPKSPTATTSRTESKDKAFFFFIFGGGYFGESMYRNCSLYPALPLHWEKHHFQLI